MLEPYLDDDTALVCVSLVNTTTGVLQPLAELAEMVHHCGALLLVEGSHALGALPLQVSTSGVDLLVCSAHTYPPQRLGLLCYPLSLRNGLAVCPLSLRNGLAVSSADHPPQRLIAGGFPFFSLKSCSILSGSYSPTA